MQDRFDNITIALAGMIQAISLARELAQTGKIEESVFEVTLKSIFQTHPKDVLEVYGSLANLKLGLERLLITLDSKATAAAQTIHYLHSVIYLQKCIARSEKITQTLIQRINQAKKQVDYFSLTHSNVIANLSDIYLNAISAFRFKFLIVGNQRILSTADNINKIRALLLAAIRSAVLWRQMGGSRLQLIFYRGRIKKTAKKLLSQMEGT